MAEPFDVAELKEGTKELLNTAKEEGLDDEIVQMAELVMTLINEYQLLKSEHDLLTPSIEYGGAIVFEGEDELHFPKMYDGTYEETMTFVNGYNEQYDPSDGRAVVIVRSSLNSGWSRYDVEN